MAFSTQLRQRVASSSHSSSSAAARSSLRAAARPARGRALRVRAAAATEQPPEGTKTLIQKAGPGDMPFPWSEKDPYKLPVSIDRVQRMLLTLGWEKSWVEQIIDRVMKGMLRTNEDRAKGVIDYLSSIGLQQDQICNMASISVVLLGLNPETRLATVVEYLKKRGVPAAQVPDVVLKHPRIFEYKLMDDGKALAKGAARIQVDVLPLPDGRCAVGVNYFRENAAFLGAPVSPMPPAP
ncbi:transcription termination factor [Raphidocelis subcapitata]|uniref:Transcription termination factor n=1 Tax=Raphidocelis subcapitata TaxID=307507 RepID=A0A2V0PIB3_9CHLO|nr:transcription termination factor [Raphidocelis subcapitata]|eukprot:GBF99524.1 transcription termination factor [Raphidocelis subcapitata]